MIHYLGNDKAGDKIRCHYGFDDGTQELCFLYEDKTVMPSRTPLSYAMGVHWGCDMSRARDLALVLIASGKAA